MIFRICGVCGTFPRLIKRFEKEAADAGGLGPFAHALVKKSLLVFVRGSRAFRPIESVGNTGPAGFSDVHGLRRINGLNIVNHLGILGLAVRHGPLHCLLNHPTLRCCIFRAVQGCSSPKHGIVMGVVERVGVHGDIIHGTNQRLEIFIVVLASATAPGCKII